MQLSDYQFHKPVLLAEMLENLQPRNGEIYVDGTFGAGGYSRAILQAANCRVFAFDRDETVTGFAEKLKNEFPNNFYFIRNAFSQMSTELEKHGIHKVDGIVLDVGVSSMQLDDKSRGFSFNSEHQLDMRMDRACGISAFEVVNQMSEAELAKIIRDFGEEKKAKLIAKKIVATRKIAPIQTNIELAEIVRSFYPHQKHAKIDPATKTFQAIRIFVNQELEELQQALESAKTMLAKNGRLIVVSFHSLEDAIVKQFLRAESGYNDRNQSRYAPENFLAKKEFQFVLPKNSAIKPSDEEVRINARSRSARMRVAVKN